MPRSDLEKPLRRLRLEVLWLHEEFVEHSKAPSLRASQLMAEMSVIRLCDSWARFCRDMIVISAYGRTTTLDGTILGANLHANLTNKNQVIPHLLSLYKKRTYEPNWHRASECINAGELLRIQNLANVSAALGANNSPAEEIRHVRNFYAHRNKDTWAKAQSTGCFTNVNPTVFDLNQYIEGSITVIDSWKQRLLAIAESALL